MESGGKSQSSWAWSSAALFIAQQIMKKTEKYLDSTQIIHKVEVQMLNKVYEQNSVAENEESLVGTYCSVALAHWAFLGTLWVWRGSDTSLLGNARGPNR